MLVRCALQKVTNMCICVYCVCIVCVLCVHCVCIVCVYCVIIFCEISVYESVAPLTRTLTIGPIPFPFNILM
jgi:hypothetical protein